MLRIKAAWLRLRLGDADGAASRLLEAKADLHNAKSTTDGSTDDVVDDLVADMVLYRAGVAMARPGRAWGRDLQRQFDGEVLKLLEDAAGARCWVPPGSQHVDGNGATEGVSDWDDFLERIAASGQASPVKSPRGVAPANLIRWENYRVATIKLATAKVERMNKFDYSTDQLGPALTSRGKTRKYEDENILSRRGRLLASLFEHPAYRWDESTCLRYGPRAVQAKGQLRVRSQLRTDAYEDARKDLLLSRSGRS